MLIKRTYVRPASEDARLKAEQQRELRFLRKLTQAKQKVRQNFISEALTELAHKSL